MTSVSWARVVNERSYYVSVAVLFNSDAARFRAALHDPEPEQWLELDGVCRRPHEGTEDPKNREEDSEEEQPSVPVSQRHDAERDEQNDVEDAPTDADSPPHDSSLAADFPDG